MAEESEAPPASASSASDFKAAGNDAYQRQDYTAAVESWNKALRQFVEEMSPGKVDCSSLGTESRALERSLYLNLAQGYLKLAEPDRALRACVVVLQEDALNGKALFRAAEACLGLKNYDKAADWLAKLLEAEPAHPEGSRLLQRVEAERRAEARKQKAAARRMLGACEGYCDGRESSQPALPDSVAHTMQRMENPMSLCQSVDIAQEAALAARQREQLQAAKAASGALPEPTVVDLDAFRAKIAAKTQKFSKYMDRSKKQRENAGHGLKLAWLRSGEDAAKLGGFKEELRKEAGLIEAEEEAAAEAAAREESAEEPIPQDSVELVDVDVPEPGIMEEMD